MFQDALVYSLYYEYSLSFQIWKAALSTS